MTSAEHLLLRGLVFTVQCLALWVWSISCQTEIKEQMSVPGIRLGSGHLAGACRLLSLPAAKSFPKTYLLQSRWNLACSFPTTRTTVAFQASANLEGWKLPIFDEPQTPYLPPEARVGVNVCVGGSHWVGRGHHNPVPVPLFQEDLDSSHSLALCCGISPSHLDMPSRELGGTVSPLNQLRIRYKPWPATGWSLA